MSSEILKLFIVLPPVQIGAGDLGLDFGKLLISLLFWNLFHSE